MRYSFWLSASWGDSTQPGVPWTFRLNRDDEGLGDGLSWTGRVPAQDDAIPTARLVIEDAIERLDEQMRRAVTDPLF